VNHISRISATRRDGISGFATTGFKSNAPLDEAIAAKFRNISMAKLIALAQEVLNEQSDLLGDDSQFKNVKRKFEELSARYRIVNVPKFAAANPLTPLKDVPWRAEAIVTNGLTRGDMGIVSEGRVFDSSGYERDVIVK
jgi:hypothetical protein